MSTFVQKNYMGKMLTDEALKKLKSDPMLFAKVALAMDISTQSLATLVKRGSKSLNNWETVDIVSRAMNKKPLEILQKEK